MVVNHHLAALCMASPPASISSPTPLVVLHALKENTTANEQVKKQIFLIISSSFRYIQLQVLRYSYLSIAEE